ncbi:phospholipase D-like domain-containing protein [Streptomyces chartreusis]|uniref:phospholipase D-like domain-containing protein n=1 Tax=Streptomyces chartreusis TaxID=1969 RepID=UPI00340EFB74
MQSFNDAVTCAYTGADGLRRRTAVRIVTHSFFGSHNKQMLIDGDFSGATTPRVYTGSANLTRSSLRSVDEAIVRLTSASYHARYSSAFHKIRSACGG